mgnify:CR=1 FL=1
MASIKDLKRMCEMQECDADCPLWREDKSCLPDDLPDNADEIVDKWVQEHPVKTYAMDFFEKFPNALRQNDGTPKCCWKFFYGDTSYICEPADCAKCWNREMKEDG